MDQEAPKKRYRLIVDFKSQFPEKLYDVVNDGALIKWNRNGSISVTSEEEFENNVMKWYPGFLQIPSFQNFKRLFREYGFDRVVNQNNQYEWSHEMFVRGRREFLSEIKTRRKSFRTPQNRREFNADGDIIIPTNGRRFPLRKRAKTKHYSPHNNETPHKDIVDYGGGGEGFTPNSLTNKQQYVLKSPFGGSFNEAALSHDHTSRQDMYRQGQKDNNRISSNQLHAHEENNRNQNAVKRNFSQLMDSYAEKEFSLEYEHEYYEWVAKQRKLDEAKVVHSVETPEKSNEYWWMYRDNCDNEIVQTINLPVRQQTSLEDTNTPCGFCKCCNSISNYVHLFGEIPENIQVIDCLEEVVESVEPEIKLE